MIPVVIMAPTYAEAFRLAMAKALDPEAWVFIGPRGRANFLSRRPTELWLVAGWEKVFDPFDVADILARADRDSTRVRRFVRMAEAG